MSRKDNCTYSVEFVVAHSENVQSVPCPSLDIAKAVARGLHRDASFCKINVVYHEVIPVERFL